MSLSKNVTKLTNLTQSSSPNGPSGPSDPINTSDPCCINGPYCSSKYTELLEILHVSKRGGGGGAELFRNIVPNFPTFYILEAVENPSCFLNLPVAKSCWNSLMGQRAFENPFISPCWKGQLARGATANEMLKYTINLKSKYFANTYKKVLYIESFF